MQHKQKGTALAGSPLEIVKGFAGTFDNSTYTESLAEWQVNHIIARKHGLPIHRAKLICRLAGIGGAG